MFACYDNDSLEKMFLKVSYRIIIHCSFGKVY